MIYYRIATQKYQSNEWEWKSATLDALEEVFRVGRQYGFMPSDQLRVFMASVDEYMDTLLVRENLGLPSNSLTLEQLMHEQQNITDSHIRRFEVELGWHEEAEKPQPASTVGGESAAASEPEYVPMSVSDPDFELDPEPWVRDYDQAYTFTFPAF